MVNKFNAFRLNSVAALTLFVFVLLSSFVFTAKATAQPQAVQPTLAGDHDVDEKFNAGEMILNHIKDAHDWHIMDIDGHPISIPLPIIIYSPQKGLAVFMSSKFDHGHASYKGYRLAPGKIILDTETYSEEEAAGISFYDFSITKNVAAMFLSIIILCLIFIPVANAYKKNPKKAPKGLQSFVEPLIMFIRDEVAKPSIGASYQKFMPFLLSIFFFIFLNNLMGLIPIFPFGANVTGNIAVTLVLAAFTFVVTLFSANKHYWVHIVKTPGVPIWLLPIMIPIEILGVISKPVVLMLRLFANMTAGHIIILAFFSLIFIFGELSVGAGYGVSVLSILFIVFMNFLELLVAFLQAYVFTLLSALYFGMAVFEEHHHTH
ncbi:MAG: F0F1 ATP synthase subunit A [Bacteroidota bacterium]|nr:F0F1 ATP synthase subunit A [Bacteroidota bacterium]